MVAQFRLKFSLEMLFHFFFSVINFVWVWHEMIVSSSCTYTALERIHWNESFTKQHFEYKKFNGIMHTSHECCISTPNRVASHPRFVHWIDSRNQIHFHFEFWWCWAQLIFHLKTIHWNWTNISCRVSECQLPSVNPNAHTPPHFTHQVVSTKWVHFDYTVHRISFLAFELFDAIYFEIFNLFWDSTAGDFNFNEFSG